MLRHELVDRGHAEEMGNAVGWVADQLQRRAGIERAHDQYRAAGMQHRVGVAIEPAGMEQRQHGEQHRRRRDIGGAAEIDAIPERHAMGDDRALGLACRARGVHDGRDVVVREHLRVIERRRSRDRRFVGTAGAEQQRGRNIAEPCDRECDLGEIGVVDHHVRRGIADNELQFWNGEARIQRQEHRADPETGELHFQRIGRVQRQNRDPVAALDVKFVAQMRGKVRDARIELRVGKPAIAGEVNGCDLVRGAAAEMRNPVIIANRRHASSVSSGLAPPVLLDGILADEGSYGDAVLRGVAGVGGSGDSGG